MKGVARAERPDDSGAMRQFAVWVWLLGCGGAAATGSTSNAPAHDDGCIGRWAGSAVQEGAPWTLELSVERLGAGRCGTIEYPSLGCGGEVLDCTVLPDGRLTMRELYTHDLGACAPAGQIYAMCSAGTMLWTWEGEGGPVTTTLAQR